MVEPGEELHLSHDLLVEHLVPGVEADPLDRVRLIVQLVLHLFQNTIQSEEVQQVFKPNERSRQGDVLSAKFQW